MVKKKRQLSLNVKCNKQDSSEVIRNEYNSTEKRLFGRIDVFDNALIRSFLPRRGPGLLLYGEVTRRPVAPFA